MVLSLGQGAIGDAQTLHDASVEAEATLSLKIDVDAVETRSNEEARRKTAELRQQRGEPKANERTCKTCGEHKVASAYDPKDWSNPKRQCKQCQELASLQM